MTEAPVTLPQSGRRPRPAAGSTPLSWQSLLRIGCLTTIAGAALLQAAGRFLGPSLVVLMIGIGVALLLLRLRRPRAAAAVAGCFTVANLLFHAGLTLSGLLHPEALWVHVLNVLGLAASVAVLTAVVPVWRSSPAGSRFPVRVVAVGALAVGLSAVLGVTAFLTRSSVTPGPGDVVVTNDGAVRPQQVSVEADDPALVFRNDDPLFPRSFDIDELGIHLTLPPKTAQRVVLPSAPATYRFYDVVTYNRATEGTVTVHD